MESFGEWFAGLWRELAGQDRAERREVLVLSYVHGPDRGEPALGLLGRSWVRRGAGYWARRAAATAAYLVLAALLGVMVLGFGPYLLYSRQYALAAHVPQAVKVLLLVVWYAPVVPAFTAMYRRLVLYGYRRDRLRDAPAPTRFLVTGPMVVLAVPFFSVAGGLILAMGAATLRPDFPGESAAREGLRRYQAAQLEQAQVRRAERGRSRRGRAGADGSRRGRSHS